MSDINMLICQYITREWLEPWIKEKKSQRAFADKSNVEESIIRKIKKGEEYRIPVETLERICEGQGITLQTFFKKLGK
uniref:helix-turn-helix domain-containing protein n=1 Tax=uncultured Christiangramia sp. TaxID=503836 RepID=UPI0026095B0B|nr:helix-turn-helix domain-containing protein [uncultured Christiangramia sp.]